MRSEQTRKFDMLRRVQSFMNDSAATLATVNATAARKELDQLVQEMGVNETAQAISTLNAKSQTASLKVLRRNLLQHHMRPVATIAAANLREVPGFTALKMPAPHAKDAGIVAHAAAMADAAREHQAVFVSNGRPQDFADALEVAATAVRTAIDGRAVSIRARAAARDGLKSTASRVIVVMRLLDTQVKNTFADDPKALAAWKSAKRIGKGRLTLGEVTLPAPATPDVKAA
jgi:hypothetical protein